MAFSNHYVINNNITVQIHSKSFTFIQFNRNLQEFVKPQQVKSFENAYENMLKFYNHEENFVIHTVNFNPWL
jgi:hypothetical protein